MSYRAILRHLLIWDVTAALFEFWWCFTSSCVVLRHISNRGARKLFELLREAWLILGDFFFSHLNQYKIWSLYFCWIILFRDQLLFSAREKKYQYFAYLKQRSLKRMGVISWFKWIYSSSRNSKVATNFFNIGLGT